MTSAVYLLAAILVTYIPTSTHAHGRMLSPVSRMSAYLAGFSTPVNYNDNEMNCGGRVVQWTDNGGKCGICGDPWLPTPRPYERPYGKLVQHNVITATYLENESIKIGIQITANHKGWMEFRVCDVAQSGGVEATHACLDKNLLADENGQTRFPLTDTRTGMFEYIVVLPEGLTCQHCVLQWYWKCGNDWGCDKSTGRCCTGCGEVQEEFYACSDITIQPRGIRFPTTTTPRPTTPTPTTRPPTTRPPTTRPTTRPTTPTRPQTQPPTTFRPTTPPPTPIRTTPTTPVPTTRKPSSGIDGYESWLDYIKKVPYPGTGSSLLYPQQQPSSSNTNLSTGGDDAFLQMVLGANDYEVHNGVPMIKNTGDTTLDPNARDRLCATCSFGCRYSACFTQCPNVCSIFAQRNFG